MYDYCELKPMALEPTSSWIARETHKSNEQQQIFIAEPVQSVQQRSGPKLAIKQNTQTERFTQTEYRANCVELVATTSNKDTVMFEQTIQQHPQPVSVQMYSTIEKKDIAPDKGSNTGEFPFCYNVLQKVHQSQTSNPTTTAVASITTADDKTCYRFDVAQPFGYNYALVNQMSLAAAASSATFKCDECGLVFAHLSLLNHHKRIHSEVNVPSDRTFQNEENGAVKVQVKTTTAKQRNCDTCGGEVYDCEHSNGAKKKVTKYVKCENCQTGPTTTVATSNESFPSSPPEPPSPPEIINIPNKGLHLVKRHGSLATVTKCHKCNGSGIIFIGGTRPSPTTTEKPFRCNVCDGSFSRYSSLWSHKRLHTGDKPFKCDMCGLTFARAAYLKNHIRVHSGEKPYKCSVCGMQFSQSPHLKNHERIHSGERPYQCEVCEKTFARHSTLWNHRRIHTGEKPYRCSVCGSAFNQATHLKNHAKVHTGEKPHRCDICEVAFSDRFALKRHRLIHEKYGRTSNNCQSRSQQPQHPNSQNQSEAHMGEMYKCEVAFPGQQPQSADPTQPQPPPPVEIYKCDVGTTVSFPQHQAAQANQSSNPPAPQITEVYKVDVANNTVQYQNQSTRQPNTASLVQQQTGQINEIYKFDVGSSVAFDRAPVQQSQEASSAQPNPPQQMAQYEVGSTAVSFTGQSQQPPPSSNSQQITQLVSNTYPERASETILGS